MKSVKRRRHASAIPEMLLGSPIRLRAIEVAEASIGTFSAFSVGDPGEALVITSDHLNTKN